METNFLPDTYSEPVVASNYMRFQEGLNRFRILSSAVTGYEYFTEENKPVRSKKPFESTPDIKNDGKVKHFWAFVVWNYQADKNEKGEYIGKVQILEITQASIRKPIMALVNNSKWGNPKNYDIAISKTGEGLETEYQVQAEPPVAEPTQDIVDAYIAVGEVDLEKLFTGEDPFTK